MGRFSPTVLPVYGPSLGEQIGNGLANASALYLGLRERKRQHAREDVSDADRRALFAQQLEATQRANRLGAQQEAVAPLAQAAELRGQGYVPDREQASALLAGNAQLGVNPALVQYENAPAPGYALDRSLTPEGRAQTLVQTRAAYDAENDQRTADREDARLKAQHTTAVEVAHIGATSRENVADTNAEARRQAAAVRAQATQQRAAAFAKNPNLKQQYLDRVARGAMAAAAQQLGPGATQDDLVSRAANVLAQDPDGLEAYGYGLGTRHLMSAAKDYGERPAIGRNLKVDEATQKAAIRNQILGGSAAAPAAPASASPSASAGAVSDTGRQPLGADAKAEAATNPKFAAFLKSKGYTEADWR